MRVTKAVKAEQLRILRSLYPNARPALTFQSPFELLIAVILSAQCTDARVNVVTGRLFPKANTPAAIAALGQAELEKEIHDCGFFRMKAKHIIETCHILLDEYDGEVPADFEALQKLPGVGRKTANSHVFRVANRLRLAVGTTPLEVEKGLQKVIPREDWSDAHHWLILHGRQVCKARKPLCDTCALAQVCPSSGA